MTRDVLILRKRRTTRQHVRDTLGRFSTKSTKGVIRMIGLGVIIIIIIVFVNVNIFITSIQVIFW